MFKSTALLDSRSIRVFISSTFQDMQDERSELIRKTFPRLRELAARRDVTLTEVDLRWGITKEESESGKVMEICLREVKNSIPFFIGIIGNRYGWIPEPKDISEIVKERFPKVPGYVERQLSATEIEMQFGVLDRTDVDMNAYFFIKKEETVDVDDPERLAALKKLVRENKKYPVSSYSDPEDLAEQVQEAFTKLLDNLFPVGELSGLEKERLGQRAVLNNLSRVYIKNEANFAVIDKWMEDWEKHQLVITGESGLGKSALVANWIKEKLKLGDALPYRIIYHFVGYGGSIGSDWHVVKALCDEIRNQYGLDIEEKEPQTDEKALDELIKQVAAEGDKPLLVILDGINQIVDVNHAKRLNWLPIPPRKVKILFTTLQDDETMQVFKDRNYPIFTLRPLTRDERIEMVRKYLDETYRKHLQDNQLERIVDDPQNENTLVLKTLLDEVANFGIFDRLDEKIEEYLKPDSIGDFYQVVLQNYEADFGEKLVRHFLSLIAVSRNGLSEDELLDITDTKDKPLLWSQFFCSFRQHMIVKNGLVSFAHNYIREAVEERYVKGQDDWVRTCREEIVSALIGQKTPDGKKTTRSMDEVPYQLDLVGDLERLHDYLLDLVVFSYLYNNEETTLVKYWGNLMQKYSLKEYIRFIDINDHSTLSTLIELRSIAYNLHLYYIYVDFEALVLQQEVDLLLCEYKKCFGKEHPYNKEFSKTKDLYSHWHNMNLAWEYVLKSLEIRIDLLGENHPDIATTYERVCIIHKLMRNSVLWDDDDLIPTEFALFSPYDTPKEKEFKEKALTIRQNLYGENHPLVAESYLNIGGYDNVLKALNIWQNLYGKYHSKVAEAFMALGDLDGLSNALKIWQHIYGENHRVIALAYQLIGKIYYNRGQSPEALYHHLRALEMRRKLYGDLNADVAYSCLDVAFCYDDLSEKKKAVEYKLLYFEIRKKLFGEDYPYEGLSCEDFISIFGENCVTEFLWSTWDQMVCTPRVQNLESICIPPNAKFDSRGDCNAIIETDTGTLIGGCMNTIIPDGVTEIGRRL